MNHKRPFKPNRLLSAVISVISLLSLTAAGLSPAADPAAVDLRLPPDPMPVYSVTWTATGEGHYEETTEDGAFVSADRLVTMSGSGIYREYSSYVGHDYFPYTQTVTDDLDTFFSASCSPWPGTQVETSTQTITDPTRYSDTGGTPYPSGTVSIQRVQRPNGTWYIPDFFWGGVYWGNYTYELDTIRTNFDCQGSSENVTNTSQLFSYGELNGPGDIEGDSEGKEFTKTTQFVNHTAFPELTVNWNITIRVLDGRDLTVDRLEVTQGLQDGGNTLPLVQGRRTVVRAYIGIGQDPTPVPSVTAKLKVYAGATLLGSVAPFNPGGMITAKADPDWQQIDDTLNFEVPYAWIQQANLRFEVEVNPEHTITEGNYNNNKLDTTLSLLACGSVSIGYTPIHYTPPGGFSPADPGAAHIASAVEFMRKIYPIREGGLKYTMVPGFTFDKNINNFDRLMLQELSVRLLTSSETKAKHLFGWFPEYAYQYGGDSNTPGAVAFGNDDSLLWRDIIAHEIGHNFGLHDNNQSTTSGRHWFDVFDRVIKPGAAGLSGKDLYDFMDQSHQSEADAWVSAQNYQYLIGKICAGGTASITSTSDAMGSLSLEDTLLVTGTINHITPATGSLDPLYHFTTIPTYTLPPGDSYCVNLKDNVPTLLSQYCFDPDFSNESGTPSDTMPFAMVVPLPAGLARVDLVQGGSLLSTRLASANPPVVTVTYPNASGLTMSGAQDVTWTGSDPNGGTLAYNILYSHDNGVSWIGIANGITGSSYNLDFSGLPGTSGASGLIKVMVSDGFHSAEDTSDNPFSIDNKPPAAVIISPSDGAELALGPQVVLEGAGIDLEDGSLGDSALSWASSEDGALGTGQLLEATLSLGTHTITLTATDSSSSTDSASIQIAVIKPPTTVLSSVRADANPTNASSVHFTVTFSEAVTGVDSTDFVPTTSGPTGASVTGVSGSGAIYTITVNTGSGDGTIRLDVLDDDSILDTALAPLTGGFTSGEAYTIDKTAPVVSSITRTNPSPSGAVSVGFMVTFSESVTGVSAADFALTTPGVTGAFITDVSGSGATRQVKVNTGSGDGSIRLDWVDDDSITDAALNPLSGAGAGNGDFASGEIYTIDKPDLAAPLLRAPSSNLITNDSTPTFSWTGVRLGASYEIQVATDNAFTIGVVSDIVSTLSDTLVSPFTDGSYFWRVRAYNASNQPARWSLVRRLTVDTTGPSAPVLTSPADNATIPMSTFRWTTVPTAVSYQFQLDNDADFSSPRYTSIIRTNYLKPPSVTNGIYHWRVRARDATGNWGAWSLPRTVTITK